MASPADPEAVGRYRSVGGEGSTGTPHDRCSPSPAGSQSWPVRARQLSRSASAAVMVLPDVTSARFSITGTREEPILTLDCTIRPTQGSAVIERLTHTVVQDLEDLLQTEFVERHIDVRSDLDDVKNTPELAAAS